MGAFENFSGKISAQIFKQNLLNRYGAKRKEVICGPKFGVDTAVIDLGNGSALAISSDPLTLIPSLGMKVSAWLSIHLLVNDMCTTGFAPQYAQFVLNLPSNLSREQFDEYWQYIHDLCETLDVSITGGHTGQVPGQDSTISGGGTMFLQAQKDKILTSNLAQDGDSLILTKGAALSSTSLLAMAFPDYVRRNLGETKFQKAINNFWKLSVLPEAMLASTNLNHKSELRAMHDVTEGGVYGAINEMADASGLGFVINRTKIPVLNEVREVAELFKIDPLISIGAGALLLSVKKELEKPLLQLYEQHNIEACCIGNFTSSQTKEIICQNGDVIPFEFDGKDPYWEAFYNALKSGIS